MSVTKNHFAKNINTKNTTPQQGRFVNKTFSKVSGKTFSKTSGFTIIEVALVLAIAGLIFLVVFLALPALQNSQKDTARKQDVARVVSAVQSYMADNNGAFPSGIYDDSTSSTGFLGSGLAGYLGKLSATTHVSIQANRTYYGVGNASIDIYVDRVCAVAASTTLTVATGSAAVVTKLSSGSYYCANV